LLIVLVGLLSLFISLLINPRGNDLSVDGNYWIMPIGAIILILLITLTILVQFFYLPMGVDIYEETNEFEIKYSLLKSTFFTLQDIKSYSTTMVHTRAGSFDGIIIHLNTGKKIFLSNFNIEDYFIIKQFLEQSGIENSGSEKFGFFSYYSQIFK
jgi:hypothetical protein